MAFSIDFPTRHTDAFAATGFVHAGVLLALTEMAYASFEAHCGLAKPTHIVAMQRETRAVYRTPLHWRDGVTIEVVTTEASSKGFTQECTVRSSATGREAATFVHRWAWVDTNSGARVDIGEAEQQKLLNG